MRWARSSAHPSRAGTSVPHSEAGGRLKATREETRRESVWRAPSYLLRERASDGLWKDPVAAPKKFVDIYGQPFTVGQAPPKKFFLDEPTHAPTSTLRRLRS